MSLILGLSVLVAVVSCLAAGTPSAEGSCDACYAGMPMGPAGVLVLENIGYTVGYSDVVRTPLWVAYRLFQVSNPIYHEKPSGFSVDYRTTALVSPDEYTNSEYDHGLMAPYASIDACYGRDALHETFLMSNIAPIGSARSQMLLV